MPGGCRRRWGTLSTRRLLRFCFGSTVRFHELDHAGCWIRRLSGFFNKSRIRGYAPERGSYVELVIAGSKAQLHMGREEILRAALEEFEMFFPEAKKATLVKSRAAEGSARYVFCCAGAGEVSACAGDGDFWAVCSGGLDADGMAFDDGGRGAQWATGGGGGGGKGGVGGEVSFAGYCGFWSDALAGGQAVSVALVEAR